MTRHKIIILLAGSLALGLRGLIAQEPVIPLSDPPQDLKGEDGQHELDLVDPFQRGGVRTAGNSEADPQGLSATSLGEISGEFRILAIVIPDDPSRQPMALIRLQDQSTPQVVTTGDLVQIKRRSPERRSSFLAGSASGGTTGQNQPASIDSALNALESYSFYLHIKDIQRTYIEAYQKKSPNETIILRW